MPQTTPSRPFVFACLLALALPGCTSQDTTAADAAAAAQLELQQGRIAEAAVSIHKSISIRDDVSEYWITLGKIEIAAGDFANAFAAYENASGLDKGNVEILRTLCQLAVSAGNPDKADKYADQLSLLNPGDTMPLTIKGEAALLRGNETSAMQYAEQVLGKARQDSRAQILKAKVLAARGDFSGAAAFIEATLASASDDASKLIYLKGLYKSAHDRAQYQVTLMRLALVKPDDPAIQLDYADMLYQTGQPATANDIITKVAHSRPHDAGLPAKILDTWLKQGPDALDISRIVQQSARDSIEIKAAYAQFLNEVGHPEMVRLLLDRDLEGQPISSANADAYTTLAYASGLMVNRTDAIARLSEILDFDHTQPRALLARARLELIDGDINKAVEDARNAVAQDPQNASARLALVTALFVGREDILGENALREGMRAMPTDVRLAARLAKLLISKGQQNIANNVLHNLTDAAPVSLRALRLRQSLDPAYVPEGGTSGRTVSRGTAVKHPPAATP